MFHSITELHRYIDLYCKQLYQKMDDELIPEVILDIVDPSLPYKPKESKGQVTLFHIRTDRKKDNQYSLSLAFDSEVLNSYYRLPSDLSIEPRSLLDVIIGHTIRYIQTTLQNFIDQSAFSEISPSDLIKKSAKHFLNKTLELENQVDTLKSINKIAALSYEKTFSKGHIVMVPHYRIASYLSENIVNFQKKIPLSSYRQVRKILELCKGEIALLSDGQYVYATIPFDERNLQNQHAFTIKFLSPTAWQYNHGSRKLMHVIYEDPYIPKPKISFFYFNRVIHSVYPQLDARTISNLYRIILEATRQHKGTILVISKNARSEAYRLRNQGFLIKPLQISPEVMLSITSIDGAVLLDTHGVCHGIGVILDGMASENGDPARGARYNSVIRYVESINQNREYANCLSVVISEDGYVNIVT